MLFLFIKHFSSVQKYAYVFVFPLTFVVVKVMFVSTSFFSKLNPVNSYFIIWPFNKYDLILFGGVKILALFVF